MDDPPEQELSPFDLVAVEALLNPFCPVAMDGGMYRPELCLPWCRICSDLLIRQKENMT